MSEQKANKVLVILSSPLGAFSASTKITKAFIESYKKSFPKDTIEYLDLNEEGKLPAFTAKRVQAKFALYGGADKADAIDEWKTSKALIEQLKSADKLVIAAPVWNSYMPDSLKLWLDHVVQPNLTFNPQTYAGLVTGKPCLLVRAAGVITVGSASDTGTKYLNFILGLIGFTDIKIVGVTGASNPAVLEAKTKEATELAPKFAFSKSAKPPTLPDLANDAKTVESKSSSLGKKVLFISASPMGENSASLTAAKAFLEEYKKKVNGAEITHLDLAALIAKGEFPKFTAARVLSKFAKFAGKGAELDEIKAKEWAYCEARIKELQDADTVVIATPMWNFSIPYSLSLYLHHIIQPHYTFNPATYKGLLTDKRTFVVAACGGPASLGGGMDYLTPYLKQMLGMIGLTDLTIAHIKGTASAERATALKAGTDVLTASFAKLAV